MKTQLVPITKIKNNPNNPRIIKDVKYNKLVESIKKFPEMKDVRPIVCNTDMEVLGGNMRLRAMLDAGVDKVPVVVVDWSEEKQREFIIKDNLSYGEWDWDILANEWDVKELDEWGLDVVKYDEVNLDNFFEEVDRVKEQNEKIVLNYTAEEAAKVKPELLKHGATYEDAIYKLLGL